MRTEAKRSVGIADRLLKLRKTLGLTQRDMAKRLGLALRTYTRSESGKRAMDEGELAILAEMGISLNWLVIGSGPMEVGAPPDGPPNGNGQHQHGGGIHRQNPIEAQLLGALIEGVANIYVERNHELSPGGHGEVVARLYDRLIAIEDMTERRGALHYALDYLQEELSRAPANLSR